LRTVKLIEVLCPLIVLARRSNGGWRWRWWKVRGLRRWFLPLQRGLYSLQALDYPYPSFVKPRFLLLSGSRFTYIVVAAMPLVHTSGYNSSGSFQVVAAVSAGGRIHESSNIQMSYCAISKKNVICLAFSLVQSIERLDPVVCKIINGIQRQTASNIIERNCP
jgi:hypothetical protein